MDRPLDAPTKRLRVADLRGLEEEHPVLQSARYMYTQEFALDCRRRGLDGILYASAQHAHHACVCLFKSGISKISRLSVTPLVSGTQQLIARSCVQHGARAFRLIPSPKLHNSVMCYSAQIRAEYKQFVRMFGGELSIRAFSELYFERQSDPKIKIPKAVDAMFLNPQTDEERGVKALIDAFNAEQAMKLEQELFKQRKRLVDAERTLRTKVTKKATDDQRIATDKIGHTASSW